MKRFKKLMMLILMSILLMISDTHAQTCEPDGSANSELTCRTPDTDRWGITDGSCYDQCFYDKNNNGGTADPITGRMPGHIQVGGDSCDPSLCCTDKDGMKPKSPAGGEKPVHNGRTSVDSQQEYFIDPRYYLQRRVNPEDEAYWDYSFSQKCRCSGRGWTMCGSTNQDIARFKDTTTIYRKFWWDTDNEDHQETNQRLPPASEITPDPLNTYTKGTAVQSPHTQGHPNGLTYSSCISISADWGWITTQITTREDNIMFSGKYASGAPDPGGGMPFGPMNIPPLNIEVELLFQDRAFHYHEKGQHDFSFEIKATKLCPGPQTIQMFDAGSPDPAYHYDPATDGERPYEPVMDHVLIPEGDSEYFYVSHEDDEWTAGFPFPEFKWSTNQINTQATLGNDCYVHYRIVTENSCDIDSISHTNFGKTDPLKNVPHPDFTVYHNPVYPWKDNSAILKDYNVGTHWFIPNIVGQNSGYAEYYFQILAEDNYIPTLPPYSELPQTSIPVPPVLPYECKKLAGISQPDPNLTCDGWLYQVDCDIVLDRDGNKACEWLATVVTNCNYVAGTAPIITNPPYAAVNTLVEMADYLPYWTTTVGGCTLPTCELRNSGCSLAYSGTYLSITNKKISGKQNVPAGYSETVCMRCTDSKGAVYDTDSLTFSQTIAPDQCNLLDPANTGYTACNGVIQATCDADSANCLWGLPPAPTASNCNKLKSWADCITGVVDQATCEAVAGNCEWSLTLTVDNLLSYELLTPGRLSWYAAYHYALNFGWRIPSLAEAQAILAITGPLAPGSDDMWVPVGEANWQDGSWALPVEDWVYIGDPRVNTNNGVGSGGSNAILTGDSYLLTPASSQGIDLPNSGSGQVGYDDYKTYNKLLVIKGSNPNRPYFVPASTPTVHSQHGNRFCSPRITMHVCGLQSSKLRKWDPSSPKFNDPTYNVYGATVYPNNYTYCSWDPKTAYTPNGGKKHKFPIKQFENTNQHCSVESMYQPKKTSGCTGNINSIDNIGGTVIQDVNPKKGVAYDAEAIPVVQNGDLWWDIQENTRTMEVHFYIQLKADGAESKLQEQCDPTVHSFQIVCCLGSATISIPNLVNNDDGLGEVWEAAQRMPVSDIGVTTAKYFHFRQPVSTNQYCKDIKTTVSEDNVFASTNKQPYMRTLIPDANSKSYRSFVDAQVDRERPHIMPLRISAQQHAYGVDMDYYWSPQYSLELYCDQTSTHYLTWPTPLTNTDSTELPDVVYKMIEPDNIYTVGPQFSVSNINCAAHSFDIDTASGFGTNVIGPPGTPGPGNYKNANGVAVQVISNVNDPTVSLDIPVINELQRDFHFKIRSMAAGTNVLYRLNQQTDDIHIRRVNCYYTTFTPYTDQVVENWFVKDIGDATPLLFEFTKLQTDHKDCKDVTTKSSQTPEYPGLRQTKLDETPQPTVDPTKLKWTVIDTHNPDDFEFYLVAQERRLSTYISPPLKITLVCGPDSTHFIQTVNEVDVPGAPELLPLRTGTDEFGAPYDFYEMINPITEYSLNNFKVSNPDGCPLISLELVPATYGSSPADWENNDKNASVSITTEIIDGKIVLNIPNITTHEHMFNFRIKATALGGAESYTDNIKIRKINCDVSAVIQDPNWPVYDVRTEEKAMYTWQKNIQIIKNDSYPDARDPTLEYPQAFILNIKECPIRHLRITKVLHHQLGTSLYGWGQKVSIDNNAYMYWHQMFSPQDKYFIHVQASAALERPIWSNDTFPIASYEIIEIPYVANDPPYFTQPLETEVFHFEEGDFDYTFNLWNLTDPEWKVGVTIDIVEGYDPSWMVFDNITRTIKFTPMNEVDYGPHQMKFVLTDLDGIKSRLYVWDFCIGKPSLYDQWDIGRECSQPKFQPKQDDNYDPDRDYSYIIDYCRLETNPWSNEDIKFASGLKAVYLPCGSSIDEFGNPSTNKNCDKILSDASGLKITQSCCHEYIVSDAAVIAKPKCKATNAILERVEEIYGTIDNLGWNAGDESSFCYHPAWMKRFPKYFDAEKEKMLFTKNLAQKHIDLPSGQCNIKAIDTKKGINCDLDEMENFLGPKMCRDGNDCRGHRDCDENGFCKGEDGCEQPFCEWIASDPSVEDWQCYLNRYDDLRDLLGPKNVIGAELHFDEKGRAEGRDKTCGQCQVRLNPLDDKGNTKLDDKLGCIQNEDENSCLGLQEKATSQKKYDSKGQIIEEQQCNVKPLQTMKLIANSQECGDGNRLRAGQFDFLTVSTLVECEQICMNQIGCEWFDYEKNEEDKSLKCFLKKRGCEMSKKSKIGSWSYRPSGYLSPDCIIEPEQEFVDNYISLVREDVCTRRRNMGLSCEPETKRRIDLNITKITPMKKMHIDYSEKLLSFDKYFKELGLNQTQLAKIGNTVLNLTYFCKQLPYNSSQDQDSGVGRNQRRARNLLIENDWMEEPELPEEIVPDLNNWFMTKFTSEEIIIDLNFTHTQLVSAYYDLDYMGVTVLQNGFFSAFEDYQFLEPNYTLEPRPIPPLCSGDDIYCGSSISLLIGLLVLLSLFLPLMLMSCINLGMGRVWSLYFMLQLITNLDNFEILKQPASTKELLQFLEEISNFKVTSIDFVKKFFTYDEQLGQNWIFREKEMVESFILYGLVLMVTFGIWKNWPKQSGVKKFKKLIIWSPILRCIMMTWFATGLWSMTWFHSSAGGFMGLSGSSPSGRRNLDQSDLQGLASRYPTQLYPEAGDQRQKYQPLINEAQSYTMIIMPFLKVLILVLFPILAYIFIKKNYQKLSDPEFKIKFSTIYTDMVHKPTAQDVILLLCGRRTIIVFTTVFLNRFHIPMVYCYIYGSIFLLSYYITKKPFNTRWAYWLELLNETHVMTAAYFSFFFTEWVTNIQARFQFSNFFVDLTVWVIILNQIGIIYETYLGVRSWHQKRENRNRWRTYLRYKEELVLLLMEYYKYFDIYKNSKENNLDFLMCLSVTQLERKIQEMRVKKAQEIVAEVVKPIMVPPPPAPIVIPAPVPTPPAPAPLPVVNAFQRPALKAKILSFAAFADRETSKQIETIQIERAEIIAQPKKRTVFADFMDHDQAAVSKQEVKKEVVEQPLQQSLRQQSSSSTTTTTTITTSSIGAFQKSKNKKKVSYPSTIIIEEDESEDQTQNQSRTDVINVYENKQRSMKSNLSKNMHQIVNEKKSTFGAYMDDLEYSDVNHQPLETGDGTYENGTLRNVNTNKTNNQSLIEENAILEKYTSNILNTFQDRAHARNGTKSSQQIHFVDNVSGDRGYDDSRNKQTIGFYQPNNTLEDDFDEEKATIKPGKKAKTNFASFMDDVPDQQTQFKK